MRINEMFNGAPKAPTNDQPQSMYVEDSRPRLVVCYPGRFQPFHLGHQDVFNSLQAKFGRDNVWVTTSNKTEEGRSPFNFSDKLAFMTASGVPVDRVIEERSPYKLPQQFSYENTIYLVVCGEQDAYRLRPGAYKEDGQPSYYQKFEELDKCLTADKHAYVVIAKERQKLITLGGKQYDASHGTECRALWDKIRNNAKQRGEFLTQLFGRNDPELGRIMDKVELDEAFGEAPLPVDTISPIHGGNPVAEGLQKFKIDLKLIESQFGEIKITGKNLIKDNPHIFENFKNSKYASKIVHSIFNQKIMEHCGDMLNESMDVNDSTLMKIFSQFSNFSTGNKVKVGDKVCVLQLTALDFGNSKPLDLEGSIIPQKIKNISGGYVYINEEVYPSNEIKQARMWRHVIFFHNPSDASKCLTAMSLVMSDNSVWNTNIEVSGADNISENTEPSDSDLFGDRSTIIVHKVNEVIDLFTNNVRGNLDGMLAEIGVERVDDIKDATDAHESDIEFIIERVGLLKFLDALKIAFNRSKEDGINLLRTGWSELDPVVNFRGITVHVPISEICDEFVSELREKHNVDITGLMWNTPLSESTEPDDEELFGKEEPIIFKLTRLLKNKQPVHIRLLNGKVWQVFEVHPEPSSKYFANIIFGKLGPDGSRHGSMSMSKMLDQRKLSLTHTNDGYMVIQTSGDKWTLNDLSETSEPSDEELFGKDKLPLIQAYEFLEKSKSVYIEVPHYQNEVFAVLSVYMDERNPRRHSDSVTFINKGYKTEELDVNQDELTIIPYKNGYLLKKTVNETTDPTDDELFGKRYQDRIADGMEDYAKKIEADLATAHPSWADHEHTIEKKKEARSARQLGDIFRKGGVEAGKGMINALMKMPKYMWLYDLHDFMKDHRGINLHDLYGDARRLEENEPSDDELFGTDFKKVGVDNPNEWMSKTGVDRRHSTGVAMYDRKFENPNLIVLYVKKLEDDKIIGVYYAPQDSNIRFGTISSYGYSSLEKYLAQDPYNPVKNLAEDAAGVGVVKNSKDPRYVMATAGDQNDVTADTLPREMRAYGLIGRKPKFLGRERRK